MAIINPTYPKPRPSGVVYVQWDGLSSGDQGLPVSFPAHPDKNLSISAANWGMGSATFEGTDDPRGNPLHPSHGSFTAWLPCTDTLDASALSKTANAGEVVLQNYAWIRPNVGGTGATGVRFNLTCVERV